jgi:hypothetical protein
MAASRLVAIHQPNFFPWLGFFDKLRRCDVFVLLDSVQFSKGSRTNRTQILVSGSPQWITAPVRRLGTDQLIQDVLIDDQRDWRSKVIKTLHASYARAPAFAASMPMLEALIADPSSRLADYNEHAIRRLAQELGLTGTSIVRASELEVSGRSTQLLVDIVHALGATAYLAGGGAGGYQDNELFAGAGVELVFQRFEPPAYPQLTATPAPGLSIIDALMQCGAEGAAELLSR